MAEMELFYDDEELPNLENLENSLADHDTENWLNRSGLEMEDEGSLCPGLMSPRLDGEWDNFGHLAGSNESNESYDGYDGKESYDAQIGAIVSAAQDLSNQQELQPPPEPIQEKVVYQHPNFQPLVYHHALLSAIKKFMRDDITLQLAKQKAVKMKFKICEKCKTALSFVVLNESGTSKAGGYCMCCKVLRHVEGSAKEEPESIESSSEPAIQESKIKKGRKRLIQKQAEQENIAMPSLEDALGHKKKRRVKVKLESAANIKIKI